MRKFAVTALLTTFALVGCSNGHPETESDLAKAFASTKSPIGLGLPPKQAKCVADIYAHSDLSREYFDAIAAGQHIKPSADDRDALDDITAKIGEKCLGR